MGLNLNMYNKHIIRDRDYFPQYYIDLEDVTLGSNSIIIDKNGLSEDFNFLLYFWKVVEKRDVFYYLEKMIKNKNMVELPKDKLYVNLTHFFDIYVFGHIYDTIQMIKRIEEVCDMNDVCFLLNKDEGFVNNLSEHFSVFGINSENSITLDVSKNYYKCDRIRYFSPYCYPGRITNNSFSWIKKKYRKKYMYNSGMSDIKLYLRRRERQVLNDDELMDYLLERGYTIIDGSESLSEHIDLFSRAIEIVGPHGSFFKNIMFCERRPLVLEFCPHNRVDYAQKDTGEIIGIDYRMIITDGDDQFNINIDLNILKDNGI